MGFWTGKVALITGGSAGLGLELARRLASLEAKVVIAARSGDRVQQAAESIRAGGGQVHPCVADVTVEGDVSRMIQQAADHFGRLDVLVNNAGRSARGRAIETTPEQFEELWQLNFLAAVRCTRAALPHLLAQRGHIVNIGSLAAKTASRYLGAYPASKFALAAYSQQLRLELSPQGVHVLLVCPGPIARQDAGSRYEEQTSDLPSQAQRPGAGVKIRGISPPRLAELIVRACQRRQPELVVPRRARWLFAISQLSPSLGDWILTKMTES